VSTYPNCHGTWDYGKKGPARLNLYHFQEGSPTAAGSNCISFPNDDRYRCARLPAPPPAARRECAAPLIALARAQAGALRAARSAIEVDEVP
jgi:hypothetical protein